ncbi:hypothetical protein GCM10022630_31830 [Thermobifida alba]
MPPGQHTPRPTVRPGGPQDGGPAGREHRRAPHPVPVKTPPVPEAAARPAPVRACGVVSGGTRKPVAVPANDMAASLMQQLSH